MKKLLLSIVLFTGCVSSDAIHLDGFSEPITCEHIVTDTQDTWICSMNIKDFLSMLMANKCKCVEF